MKPNIVRNALVFWPLLYAIALGQERRDPTVPGPTVKQRMAETPTEKAPLPTWTLKALVLKDADHGTALIQTAIGTQRVSLDRDVRTEVMIGGSKFIVADFGSGKLILNPIARSDR